MTWVTIMPTPAIHLMNFFLFLLGALIKPLSATESSLTSLSLSDQEYNEIRPGENISFFTERLRLDLPLSPKTADLPGKFIRDYRDASEAELYDVPLLQECADLNYALMEVETLKKKNIQKFVKLVRNSMEKDTEKFKTTLDHFHCVHAIKNVGFDGLGADLVKKLSADFPHLMKKHLDVFAYLEDFSFLTVEMAEILYEDKNDFLRPFGLENLVRTVSYPVMKKFLEMWNYDLRSFDAGLVINIWGQQLEQQEEDPRAWLLWRKIGIFKPFPSEKLIEKLNIESLELYVNLVLAFVHDSEIFMNHMMGVLEFINADLHKNDPIEEQYMTPKMVSDLDSRKWDLWYERGKPLIEMIDIKLKLKMKLVEKLKSIKEELLGSRITEKQVLVYNLLILLRIPLNSLARASFVKSRNVDNVITALEEFSFNRFPGYSVTVHFSNLKNENYWIAMWKQLEIFEIDLSVYDEKTCTDFMESKELLQLLLASSYSIFKQKLGKNMFWHSQLAMLLITPMTQDLDTSQIFCKALIGFIRDQICELSPAQIGIMKIFLHPEALEEHMARLENRDFNLELFRLAPEIMSRDQIYELLDNPESRELMKFSRENANRLRYLDSFSTDDLALHFPLGVNYHLDSCEALYTVDPAALAGYLDACQGAVNYPDLLIWWTHPRCWENPQLVDLMAETIPFSVFVKRPREADDMNLINILTDITGRIERNPMLPAQVMILKWLIHMDWFYFQFYNEFFLRAGDGNYVDALYDRILGAEKKARAKLITWLKEHESLEDRDTLLELAERTPLSYLRCSVAYDLLLSESVWKLGKGPSLPHFKEIHPQFSVFKSVPMISKLREADLETAVRESVEKCEIMVQKHFRLVEREIWKTRLRIANIPKFEKYSLHPVPRKFSDVLYARSGAPFHDLQDAFTMFSRTGHSMYIDVKSDSEFLEQLPQGVTISNNHNKNHADFVMRSRKILIENDLKLMRLKK